MKTSRRRKPQKADFLESVKCYYGRFPFGISTFALLCPSLQSRRESQMDSASCRSHAKAEWFGLKICSGLKRQS